MDIRTIYWIRLFFWIHLSIAIGSLTACGSNGSAIIDETIEDGGATIPTDVEALSGSTWTLRVGDGPAGDVALVDGWPITMSFSDETFGGTAACNDYGGSYSIDGSTTTFAQIGYTEKACIPDVQASESAFLSAVYDIDGISLLGDELVLTGVSSKLIFAFSEPAPLDALLDQLWVLQEITFNDEETAPIGESATLRINSDGNFSATTGCRTLTGLYIVSGSRILFNEMAADGNCPAPLSDQDSQVISVLEGGFTAAIDDNTLVLVAAGNRRLRYQATDDVSGLSAKHILNVGSKVWNENSIGAKLYLPTYLQVNGEENTPPPAIAVIGKDSATPEQLDLLQNLIYTKYLGTHAICDVFAEYDLYFIIVEQDDGSLKRFSQKPNCSVDDEAGFFRKPVDGYISNKQLCALSSTVGATGSICIFDEV